MALVALGLLVAQQQPDPTFTPRDLIGPYGALIGAVIVIGVLMKMVKTLDDQLEAAEERERALYDRVIEVTGGTAALLERNTRVIERIEGKL